MADPAPLVSTPDAQVPAGAEAEWVRGAGGAKIRAAIFRPEGRPRGSVVLSGGRAEFIEKYYEIIQEFTARGLVVLAHDWRGQGLSSRDLADRLKGHAAGYKSYLADYQAVLGAFEDRLPRPWIAVGHSMGGCLTLLALAHGERRFAAAMLSAPMLGIRTGKVPRYKARLAAGLQSLLGRAARYVNGQPGDPFGTDFEANILTHDRARFLRSCGLVAAEPQLAIGGPTWGWLDFALRATAYLARPERLRSITIPVVILQAEDDRLVDNAAQGAAARHLPQGKLIRVPGAYHEILMETDPMLKTVMRVFDNLLGRTAPKPAEPPKPAPAAAAKPEPAPAPAPAATPAPAAQPAAAKPAVAKPAAAKPAAAKKAAPKKTAAKPTAAKAKAKPAAAAKPAPAKAKPAAKAAPSAKPAAKGKPAAKPAAAKAAPKAAKPAAKAPAAKPAKAAAAKPVVTKAAAASAAAPKTAKPAAKTPAAQSPAAKTAAAKKPAAAKSAAPKAAAKKPAAKKPAAKTPA
jgi:lysophospholipase